MNHKPKRMIFVAAMVLLTVAQLFLTQPGYSAAGDCVAPDPETKECPRPPRKPVQKKKVVYYYEAHDNPDAQEALPKPLPKPEVLVHPKPKKRQAQIYYSQPAATPVAATYVPPPVPQANPAEKTIITIDQRQFHINSGEPTEVSAREASKYYRKKALAYKAAYEREVAKDAALEARLATLLHERAAGQAQLERQTQSQNLSLHLTPSGDRRDVDCCDDCDTGRRPDVRWRHGDDCCRHDRCREEPSPTASGLYLGLVGGVGPNGVLRDYSAETDFAIVKQAYTAFVGLRLMGVSDSGVAGGVQVMSNGSLSLDLDFKVH